MPSCKILFLLLKKLTQAHALDDKKGARKNMFFFFWGGGGEDGVEFVCDFYKLNKNSA